MIEPKNKTSAGGKTPGKGDPGRDVKVQNTEAAVSWRREEQKGAPVAREQHREHGERSSRGPARLGTESSGSSKQGPDAADPGPSLTESSLPRQAQLHSRLFPSRNPILGFLCIQGNPCPTPTRPSVQSWEEGSLTPGVPHPPISRASERPVP